MDRNEIAGPADYANGCGVVGQSVGNSESPVHSALHRLSYEINELHKRFEALEARLRFVCLPPDKNEPELACPEQSPHSGLVCALNQHAEQVEALISRAHKLLGTLEI